MKVDDVISVLDFSMFPFKGLDERRQRYAMWELFLNYREGFQRMYRRYPELAARALRDLSEEDTHGYASGEIKKFIDSVPSYEALGKERKTYNRKMSTYAGILIGGLISATAYLSSVGHSRFESYAALFALLLLYMSVKRKAKGCSDGHANLYADYSFKREFENGAGQK